MRGQNDPDLNAAYASRQNFTAAVFVAGSQVPASSATITREMTGDLPDTVTLVGGGVSSTVTVSGDDQVGLVAGAVHPLRPAERNAMLQGNAQVRAGYAGELRNAHVGRVREISFDREARTVDYSFMDRSDLLRSPVTVHAFGSSRRRQREPARYERYPTNLSAVVVAALHANDMRVTPKASTAGEVLWSAPFLGGFLSEVGWSHCEGVGIPTGSSWLVPGPFGPVPRTTAVSVWGYPGSGVWADETSALTLQIIAGRPNPTSPSALATIHAFGNEIELQAWRSGATTSWRARASLDIAPSGGHMTWISSPTIELDMSDSDIVRAAVVVTSEGLSVVVTPGASGGSVIHREYAVTGLMNARGFEPWISELRVEVVPDRVASAALVRGSGFAFPSWSSLGLGTPPRVDQALLDVDYVPIIDKRGAWDLLKELATAELGSVGFDEDGHFAFKNRDSINGSTAPVATWSADLRDTLAGSVSIDSVRSRVTAPIKQSAFVGEGLTMYGVEDQAEWSAKAEEILVCPPGKSTHSIRGPKPFYLRSNTIELANGLGGLQANPSLRQGVMQATVNSSGTTFDNSNTSARVSMVGPLEAVLTVRNTSTFNTYVRLHPDADDGAGTAPAGVALAGRALLWDYPERVVDVVRAATVATWGDRPLELGAHPWRQDEGSLRVLATKIVNDLREPRVELSDITVPADMRWEVGDVIRLTDASGLLPEVRARIVRYVLTISLEVENGMTGTYSLRQITS